MPDDLCTFVRNQRCRVAEGEGKSGESVEGSIPDFGIWKERAKQDPELG